MTYYCVCNFLISVIYISPYHTQPKSEITQRIPLYKNAKTTELYKHRCTEIKWMWYPNNSTLPSTLIHRLGKVISLQVYQTPPCLLLTRYQGERYYFPTLSEVCPLCWHLPFDYWKLNDGFINFITILI